MKDEKTNVMRLLEQKKVTYKSYNYVNAGTTNGEEIAAILGQDPKRVFKTLVTVGRSGEHFVFMIPVEGELDLKKAARAAGEKNIEMIKSKDLLPTCGYVHGGCSPIGMKKLFKTFADASAESFETVFFSAGKIGYQVEVAPTDLARMIPVNFCDLCI